MGLKQMLFFTYILIFVFNLNKAEKADNFDHNMKIFNEYVEMDRLLKELADRGVKLALPYLMEARENINISTDCTRNLFQLLSGLRRLTDWSLKFLDATGKLQSGVMAGNVLMFGEYEECIETTSFKKNGKLDFQGQYCSVAFAPHLPVVKPIPTLYQAIDGLENATRNVSDVMKFMLSRLQIFYGVSARIGVCVPSGCNKQDVTSIAKYGSEMFYMNASVEYCLKKGDIYFWTKTRIAIVCLFVLLGILTLTSTVLDNFSSKYTRSNSSIASEALMCFSLTRNFPKLMDTKASDESLTSLHALRFLGVLWVILGHEYIMHGFLLSANHAMYFEELFPKFFSQIPLNGFIVVDTFFFLSGFLNSYIRTNIKQNGRKQPGLLKIFMHRLWRLYPTLIVGHFIFYLLHKPVPYNHHILEEDSTKCDRWWWRNFIFINNFYSENICVQQSWYLSVDMQLFVFSLITIPVLLRRPRIGVILNFCMIAIGCLSTALWWWLKELPPHVDFTLLSLKEVMKPMQGYLHPFQHCGPYFIGILMGYMISTKKKIKISKVHQMLGWIIASFCFISMVFITQKWNAGNKYTALESIAFGIFNRIIFTLGFAWMVLCCVTGHGGVINYILSLKLWYPLGKMSYMLYMISPCIQVFYHSNLRFPFDASNITIIWSYFGSISVSLLLSLSLVVTVESPVIALEKILFRKNEADKKSSIQKQIGVEINMEKTNDLNDKEKYIVAHL